MLQKEFEERVGMKVTPSEYGVIETLYNDSDLEKDEFCAKWKKKTKKNWQNSWENFTCSRKIYQARMLK